MQRVLHRLVSLALPISIALSAVLFQSGDSGQARWDAAMLGIVLVIPAGAFISFLGLILRLGRAREWELLWPKAILTSLVIVAGIALSLVALGAALGYQGIIISWLIIWFIAKRLIRHLIISARQ